MSYHRDIAGAASVKPIQFRNSEAQRAFGQHRISNFNSLGGIAIEIRSQNDWIDQKHGIAA
jgi:hypothetical protein